VPGEGRGSFAEESRWIDPAGPQRRNRAGGKRSGPSRELPRHRSRSSRRRGRRAPAVRPPAAGIEPIDERTAPFRPKRASQLSEARGTLVVKEALTASMRWRRSVMADPPPRRPRSRAPCRSQMIASEIALPQPVAEDRQPCAASRLGGIESPPDHGLDPEQRQLAGLDGRRRQTLVVAPRPVGDDERGVASHRKGPSEQPVPDRQDRRGRPEPDAEKRHTRGRVTPRCATSARSSTTST
jgi:hypothetical protein